MTNEKYFGLWFCHHGKVKERVHLVVWWMYCRTIPSGCQPSDWANRLGPRV